MDEIRMKAIQGLYDKREECHVAQRVSVKADGAKLWYAPRPPIECDTSQGCNNFWISW